MTDRPAQRTVRRAAAELVAQIPAAIWSRIQLARTRWHCRRYDRATAAAARHRAKIRQLRDWALIEQARTRPRDAA
jgi:hypothetical protein